MLTLDQLISAASVLSDSDKAILIDEIAASMTASVNQDILTAGIKQAQSRLAEIDGGAVQTIPGDMALAQVRQLIDG